MFRPIRSQLATVSLVALVAAPLLSSGCAISGTVVAMETAETLKRGEVSVTAMGGLGGLPTPYPYNLGAGSGGRVRIGIGGNQEVRAEATGITTGNDYFLVGGSVSYKLQLSSWAAIYSAAELSGGFGTIQPSAVFFGPMAGATVSTPSGWSDLQPYLNLRVSGGGHVDWQPPREQQWSLRLFGSAAVGVMWAAHPGIRVYAEAGASQWANDLLAADGSPFAGLSMAYGGIGLEVLFNRHSAP